MVHDIMRDQTARQKKQSSSNQSHSNSPVSKNAPLINNDTPLQPARILQLQRMLGNQAVQRLLQRQPSGIQQRSGAARIHRKTDFGLADGSKSTSYVDKAHAYINDVANKDKSLTEMATHLGDCMANELKSIGVPPIPVVVKAGADMGVFRFRTWVLEADPGSFSKNAATTTVGKLTKAEAAEIVDTIYHESRHGEQWYRMAQMKAGEGWDADKIVDKMKIPKTIAEEAFKNPLPKITDDMRRVLKAWLGDAIVDMIDDAYGQVNTMFESVYRDNKKYRGLVLSSEFETEYKTVSKSSGAVTAANRAATVTKLQTIMTNWETTILPDKIETELTRVNAISPKSANDTKMVTHLTAMKTAVKGTLDTWKAGTTVDDIKKLKPFGDQLNSTLYAAYKDLPEEADAWSVAAGAKAKYNAK